MRIPTAPFREEQVRAHIVGFCRDRAMRVHEDKMGNVIADWPARATWADCSTVSETG